MLKAKRPLIGVLLLLCVIIATFNCELVDKQIIKSIIELSYIKVMLFLCRL